MGRTYRVIIASLVLLFLLLTSLAALAVEAPDVTHLYSFSEGLDAPVRIAADAMGNFYVTDIRKDRVCVLDAYGNLLRHIYGIQAPLSVAVDHRDRLYVGGETTRSVVILTPEGTYMGELGIGRGQFTEPTDIAIDSDNNIYVVDSRENCVKVFDENWEHRSSFGSSVLQFPTGIAIDEANDAILVGQYGGMENGEIASRVQIFSMQGEWRSSFGSYGEKPGEFTRIQGLAVDEQGRIYVTDSYQANVQVVDYSGNPLSSIGNYGDGPGELRVPFDVTLDSDNRLWVTSLNTGSIEVFGADTRTSPDDQTSALDSFTINLIAGFNFVSVPLKPATDWRLSDLAEHIGDGVVSVVTYISEQDGTACYLPSFSEDDPTNILVKGNDSYIIVMDKDKSVTFQGAAWEGKVAFPQGMSMFAVPLEPDDQWDLGDLANHVGEELIHLITLNRSGNAFEVYTPSTDPSSSISLEGGVGYLAVMSKPKTVVFKGSAWNNNESFATAPRGYDIAQLSNASVLVVQGKVINPNNTAGTLSMSQGIRIQVRNQSTGVEKDIVTKPNGDYVTAFVDFAGNRAANVGDTIRVKLADPQWTTQTMPYELTAEDLRMSHVALPTTQLEVMPKKSVLLRNYPNPANPETWIPYRLSKDADVRVDIYSISGQLVRILNLGIKEAGNYVDQQRAAYWDGCNDVGEIVASGVYFYVIRAGVFGATGRMVILK